MKKLILSILAALGVAVAVPAMAFAYGGNQTNASQCGSGKLVVNVTYNLYNDYDSGVGVPQGWANDTINRHLQIRQVSSDTYCATVSDTGSFVTFVGSSPAGDSTVAAGIKGVINGGYRTTVFQGTLDSSPAYATKGQLGSFDLQCTDAYTCPGEHPSYLSYFTITSGDDLAWWGWEYKTPQNGTWINALDVPGTSQGDISGS